MADALISVNQGEYGIAYVFRTTYDISGFTSISIRFIKPDGSLLIASDPDVTVPGVDISTSLGIFAAGTYAQYAFQDGDLDQAGDWSARIIYLDATPLKLISNSDGFTVNQVESITPPSTSIPITTEDGYELITEDGDVIVTEGA